MKKSQKRLIFGQNLLERFEQKLKKRVLKKTSKLLKININC